MVPMLNQPSEARRSSLADALAVLATRIERKRNPF